MTSGRCFATVITRSYLADARALARSIRRFHADPIYVLCIDDPDGFVDPRGEPFTLLTLNDVLPPEDRAQVFYYTAFELCNSCRAYLHRYLRDRTNHESWVYLDSDIFVTAPLDPLFAALTDAGTCGLFTAHCLDPAPIPLIEPVETSLQMYGVYNSGFLALRRTGASGAFVDWFVSRLRVLCFFMERGVYVDQLWMNLLPELFPDIRSWKHRGANVAYWNIHERVITADGDRVLANGEPLLFMHFSRWNIEHPEDWSFGRPVANGSDPAVVAALGRQYRDALLECGYSECRRWPYGFARFSNCRSITKAMRRAYYEDFIAGRAGADSPFEHPERFPIWKYPPDIWPALRRAAGPLRSLRRRLMRD